MKNLRATFGNDKQAAADEAIAGMEARRAVLVTTITDGEQARNELTAADEAIAEMEARQSTLAAQVDRSRTRAKAADDILSATDHTDIEIDDAAQVRCELSHTEGALSEINRALDDARKARPSPNTVEKEEDRAAQARRELDELDQSIEEARADRASGVKKQIAHIDNAVVKMEKRRANLMTTIADSKAVCRREALAVMDGDPGAITRTGQAESDAERARRDVETLDLALADITDKRAVVVARQRALARQQRLAAYRALLLEGESVAREVEMAAMRLAERATALDRINKTLVNQAMDGIPRTHPLYGQLRDGPCRPIECHARLVRCLHRAGVTAHLPHAIMGACVSFLPYGAGNDPTMLEPLEKTFRAASNFYLNALADETSRAAAEDEMMLVDPQSEGARVAA